jgi:outer membrane protein
MKSARILTFAFAALSMVGVSARAADTKSDIKIGYVDLQKAITETSTGKAARKELEKEYNAKKDELQKKEANIKKMQEDLEKKKAVLTDEVRQAKAAELQGEMMKFQQLYQQSQISMQKKEQELTKPVLEKLQGVLEKIAKDGGYTVILEKSEQSVLWAKKELDVTDELVKKFEATK